MEDSPSIEPEIDFECFICQETFPNIDDLFLHRDEKHEKIESREAKFSCEHCDKSFNSISVVQRHVKEVHFKNKRFNCKLCSASFYKKGALGAHVTNSHPNKQEPLKVNNDDEIDVKIEPSEIIICDVEENNPEEVIVEMTCPECGQNFPSSEFENHVKTHKKIEHYQCEHCEKVFKLAKYFVNHQRDKKCHIYCKKCDQKFSCRSTLKQHLENNVCSNKIVKKTVPSHCQVCHELFDSKQELRQHIMELHKEIQMFKCDHCPLIFPTASYMNTHLRFKHKMNMRDQKNRYTSEESSVECPLCKRTYMHLSKLKDHISSHHRNEMTAELAMVLSADNVVPTNSQSPEKPKHENSQMCHLCNNAVEFNVKEDYDKHMNEVHQYIHNCKFCKKWFGSEYRLRDHLKKYHNISAHFKCHFCDEISEDLYQAKAHYKAEHLDEELVNDEAFYMVCPENDGVRVSLEKLVKT